MTTPTALSLPTAVTPPAGQAKCSGKGNTPGGAEDFASLVAGLIAGILGPPGQQAPADDTTKGATDDAAPDAAADVAPDAAKDATPPGTGDATVPPAPGIPTPTPDLTAIACAPNLANVGRVPAPSEPVDRAETRPTMQGAGATTAPTTPDSGAVAGLSSPVDAPATQPESGPQPGPNEHKFASHGKERSAAAHAANEARQAALFGGTAPVSGAPEGRAAQQKPEALAPLDAPADTPTPTVAPVAAPGATTATAPVDPPAPAPAPAATAAQLAAPVVAVHRHGTDGIHTMTVDITPDELGPVRVHVELRDGNVELRLAGHSEAARDALRAALPELRRALEAAGVGTGSFQISPESPPFQDRSQNQNTSQQPQFGPDTDARNPSGGNPQNGHARPAWAGTDGRVPHQADQLEPAVAGPAGSLDLAL